MVSDLAARVCLSGVNLAVEGEIGSKMKAKHSRLSAHQEHRYICRESIVSRLPYQTALSRSVEKKQFLYRADHHEDVHSVY